MTLTEAEKQSAVWQKVSKELNERLAVMREKNDSDLAADETATLRGRIKMCREILGWATPTPKT